jgi:hypothetical protein
MKRQVVSVGLETTAEQAARLVGIASRVDIAAEFLARWLQTATSS